jgi:O-antigen ligase
MQLGFEKKQSYLPVTDRIQPHNQFLELALQTGIITTLLFVILLIFMFMHFRRTANYSGLAVLTALAASMFFESYLERQSGVAVFVVSLFFVLFAEKKE